MIKSKVIPKHQINLPDFDMAACKQDQIQANKTLHQL